MRKRIHRMLFGLLSTAILLVTLAAPAFAANVTDFTDVPWYEWYHAYVAYAAEKNLVNGTSTTTFSPGDNITRAQFITIIYAYLKDTNTQVYSCDTSKKATVITINDGTYTIADISNTFQQLPASELQQQIGDGFYYWYDKYLPEKQAVKIEYGQMVKDASRTDAYGNTYYFDHTGLGRAA